jgi:hypothetical protein
MINNFSRNRAYKKIPSRFRAYRLHLRYEIYYRLYHEAMPLTEPLASHNAPLRLLTKRSCTRVQYETSHSFCSVSCSFKAIVLV